MDQPEFEKALAAASAEVRDLAQRARAFVLGVLPQDIIESVDGTDIGYGWTAGYAGLICVISVYPRWVNLGIASGAGLPDPSGLMRGSGKRHGFVRIASAADLERPELRDLVLAALAAQPRTPQV